MKTYDVIIIGAGPAGLSAGLYAGRARLDTLIIEKERDGGQIIQTAEVENYPGGEEFESGPTIIEKMMKQAAKFGAEKVYDSVEGIEVDGDIRRVKCTRGTYEAKSVIIAGGASAVKIGCPGEAELTGQGVSYCATCDGAFFQNMEVYVVGGGDAAVEEAIFLTRFARKVTVIHRRDELRAAKYLVEEAMKDPKIEFMWDSIVEEITGEGIVSGMRVKNVKSGEIREIKADEADGMFGIFVFIGFKPTTEVYADLITLENGYIKTDEDMKTNVPGIFAAGDIRQKSLRQVVTAAADGAIAATQAEKYIAALTKM